MSNIFTSKITVIDSIMGSGKTSFLINYMNENIDEKFCYITPYRDEITRVIDNCSVRVFETPRNYDSDNKKVTTKHEDMVSILNKGLNVVSTHALFKTFNDDMKEALSNEKYTLILDEVVDVVEQIKISKDDIQILIDQNIIMVDDNHKIQWIDDNYNGEFSKYRDNIINGEVFLYNGAAILWCFPTEIFKYFDKVIISTYLFRGQIQCYYFQANNMEFEYKSVESYTEVVGDSAIINFKLCNYKHNQDLSSIKELINLYDGKLNDIGKKTRRMKNTPLTKTWYDNATNEQLKKIKDNTYNYFRNICKKKYTEVIWTTFKDRFSDESKKIKVIPRGFKNGYIPSNLRATNEYKNRDTVAYLIDKYPSPMITNFLKDKGALINNDAYAVSELVQFVWRSCIRDGKEINLYIPSDRMRKLMNKWLEGDLHI